MRDCSFRLLFLQRRRPPLIRKTRRRPKRVLINTRYSLAVIDDATFYSDLRTSTPQILNQVLVEPTFDLRYRNRLTLSTSLIGISTTYSDTVTRSLVKETYAGLSAGDFDFTAGRKMVRWGTGYAFTAAGVLDPPRDPTNPSDRLNVNQGRDMVKADWVRGPHAFTLRLVHRRTCPGQLHTARHHRVPV